jgi:hypothetical protein
MDRFLLQTNDVTTEKEKPPRSLLKVLIASATIAVVWVACIAMGGIWAARVAVPRLLNHRFGGQPSTVNGELVETFCWATQVSGGPSHSGCAMECARRGIPIAIVDERTHRAFVLLPDRGKAALPPGLFAAMGHQVTIHGEIFMRGGSQFAMVRSWHLRR